MWLCGYVDNCPKIKISISCFFDRYEIHIQDLVDFINGKLIIFQYSSSQNIFCKFNIFKISKFQDFKISKVQKVGYTHVPTFSDFWILIFPYIIFFHDVPIYFHIFFEVVWYTKDHKYGGNEARFDQ